MNRVFLGAAFASLFLVGCAQTQKAADTTVAAARAQVNPTLSTSDATFLTEAARGGIAEIRMGELAQRNGRSAAVKNFGRRMATEHGQANTELMALARQKEISTPESMGAGHQRIYDDLAKLRGGAFDRAYAKAMVEDHQEDVRLHQEEAANGTDPDVKAFAARQVPDLQEHLRMAQRLPQR